MVEIAEIMVLHDKLNLLLINGITDRKLEELDEE